MVDRSVLSDEIVSAFERLRELWKGLYNELPKRTEREDHKKEIGRDLDVVVAAARVSDEARPFVELAYLVRMDEWRGDLGALSSEAEETTAGVRSGFEMRLRTLRQMESGDEILSDTGREIRRTAARDLVFFRELTRPAHGEGATKGDPSRLENLVQSFDQRRKLVREDVEVPNSAVEALEFLVRLGAG